MRFKDSLIVDISLINKCMTLIFGRLKMILINFFKKKKKKNWGKNDASNNSGFTV